MVILGRPNRGRSSALPAVRKRSWRRRMTEWPTPSSPETSRRRIPSVSHPRARRRSSVLSLRSGGMLTQALIHYHHHHHLSLNREGRWGTSDFLNQFSPFFPVLHCPMGLGELQACPFPDVAFPHLPLSALTSFSVHCAVQNSFGQT